MGWYLAPSLVRFRQEINDLWPLRDKTSDGTIGDAAHQATKSDHNPNERNSVNAIDIDANGVSMDIIINAFEKHPAAQYWIYRRRIASRDSGWKRWSYEGPNPHDKHAHFSIRQAVSAERSITRWFPVMEDDKVDASEIKAIAAAVHGQKLGSSDVTIGQALQQTHREVMALPAKINAILAAIFDIDDEVVRQLGSAELTAEQIAMVLGPVLGGRKKAVAEALMREAQ